MVVVDWKILLSVKTESLLKVRLRRKAGHAEERAAFHSAPRPQLRLPQLRKINCALQNALVEKGAWWAAMCYAGLPPKSLLKVRLRCKAGHAKEHAAFYSAPRLQLRSASASPQNQLHLAECTCRKSCMVCCDATTAKS